MFIGNDKAEWIKLKLAKITDELILEGSVQEMKCFDE